MFAKWDNGLMLVSETAQDGYKPMQTTEAPEAPSGYEALFFWKETDDAWVQTWEIVPETEDDLTAEEIAAAIEEVLA